MRFSMVKSWLTKPLLKLRSAFWGYGEYVAECNAREKRLLIKMNWMVKNKMWAIEMQSEVIGMKSGGRQNRFKKTFSSQSKANQAE